MKFWFWQQFVRNWKNENSRCRKSSFFTLLLFSFFLHLIVVTFYHVSFLFISSFLLNFHLCLSLNSIHFLFLLFNCWPNDSMIGLSFSQFPQVIFLIRGHKLDLLWHADVPRYMPFSSTFLRILNRKYAFFTQTYPLISHYYWSYLMQTKFF